MNRSNYVLLASLFIAQVFAQTPTPITLEEAIALSLKNGKEIKK
ncbi:hypothetical protein QNH98_19100 [Myroides sp. mNGS23_01]|nr:hypothetical protein [Myroides sp. mNGS23_01]WHT39031.1 hypothetical protein QNH98_19100 [Myroides sp. mNGS23_01]